MAFRFRFALHHLLCSILPPGRSDLPAFSCPASKYRKSPRSSAFARIGPGGYTQNRQAHAANQRQRPGKPNAPVTPGDTCDRQVFSVSSTLFLQVALLPTALQNDRGLAPAAGHHWGEEGQGAVIGGGCPRFSGIANAPRDPLPAHGQITGSTASIQHPCWVFLMFRSATLCPAA